MTIGFILDSDIDFPGGVQSFVKGLYTFITRKGYKAVICTGGDRGKSEDEGYCVYRLGSTQILPGNGTEINAFADWVECNTIRSIVKKESIDVLHIQGVFGLLGMRFLDCVEKPSLVSFHNFVEEDRFPGILKIFFPLLKHYIDKTDMKIADSKTSMRLAQQIVPGEYTIIPPGLNVHQFSNALPRRIFPKHMIEVLYVGRLDERKGIMYLLRAFRSLQETESNIALTVIGKGPLREQAEQFVTDSGIKNVKFLGYVSDKDLPCIYKGADIYCSPATRGECFGIVLTEAMAAGLPIVAFDNAGYRNVLRGKGKEFLVPNKDIDRLVAAIDKLISDEDLRREMTKWSKQEVMQYDWGVVGARYLEIYERLLSSRGYKNKEH